MSAPLRQGVPTLVVRGVLQLKSATGRSYSERIDGARTEKDLSDIFEDFIGTVPMGRTLFAERNPIRTRGPMQVHVRLPSTSRPSSRTRIRAREHSGRAIHSPGRDIFRYCTSLAYPAPYDRYLFRFADFNAGHTPVAMLRFSAPSARRRVYHW